MNTYTQTQYFPNSQYNRNTLQDAIFNAGLGRPDVINDEEIHRFSAPDDKHGSNNCWYISFGSAGKFGSWKLDFSETWNDGSHSTNNAELSRQIKKAQRQRDNKKKYNHKKAQEQAQKLWAEGSAIINHSYPEKKQIKPYGARQYQGALLIPMYFDNQLVNIHRIFPDGNKRFLKGGRVTGCYMPIGKMSDHVFICEGYATGCSYHEHTGSTVVVGFNAGNLEPVTKIIRGKYPSVKITIAADNDVHTDGNPGLTKARKAALAVDGDIIYPNFSDIDGDGTDFNDYINAGGAL